MLLFELNDELYLNKLLIIFIYFHYIYFHSFHYSLFLIIIIYIKNSEVN